MIGELIPTGVTFGVGRNSINDQFSGTAEFNNITLESGANFSGGTGGGIIYSAGTDLYNIFITTADGNDITRVQPGTNTTTGGTYNFPVVNIVDSPSFNSITASGSSSFATLSASTIYSGNTNLGSIILGYSGTSGNLWSASTGSNSIITNNDNNNTAYGECSFVSGSGNTMHPGAVGNFGSILGGVSNSMTHIGGSFTTETSNSIIGGNFNEIRQTFTSPRRSAIIGGRYNLLSAQDAAIIGGSGNTVQINSDYSVVLGGQGLNVTKNNTAIMQRGHINEFFDLLPQTTLPTAEIGRVFFSGTPLNRIMYNTGGTDSDWIII
jgi:hypothetical protein